MAFSSSKLMQTLRLTKSRISCFSLSHRPQNGVRGVLNLAGRQSCCIYSVAEGPEFEADEVCDYKKATEKETVLRMAISQLAGDFGKESMLSLHRFFGTRRTHVISTGSLKLDLALGIGGLPAGRIIEIYGREASGKTTLALQIIKEAQKLGGYCAYFDVENAMDPILAESMGVDTEKLLLAPPGSAENILSSVNTLTKSGSVDVIVVDSVAALVPQCELDVPFGHSRRDVQSQLLNQALKKIHHSIFQSKTLIIFVNQVRSHVKLLNGSKHMVEETCGGNALNFYAAVRLGIKRIDLLKTEDEVNGLAVCVEVVKNKLAPAMQKADLSIIFGKGICSESEVFGMACDHGVILKEGNSYFIEGNVFHDEHSARHYLAENPEIHDNIIMTLRKILFEVKRRL